MGGSLLLRRTLGSSGFPDPEPKYKSMSGLLVRAENPVFGFCHIDENNNNNKPD